MIIRLNGLKGRDRLSTTVLLLRRGWVSTVLAGSVLLYAASLCCRGYCDESHTCGPGWLILLVGWPGVVKTTLDWPWLANPALFLAWLAGARRSGGWLVCWSWAALALAASFMLRGHVVDNEGWVVNSVMEYRAGYWLWLGSMAILALPTGYQKLHSSLG